jgi:hypothetical protein
MKQIIRYEYDEDSLGLGDTKDIDLPATFHKFEQQVESALQKAFPDAEISVTYDVNCTSTAEVDGDQDHDLTQQVMQIGSDVWQSWRWLVRTGRPHIVNLRLTSEEHSQLLMSVRKLNMSTSDYIRRKIFPIQNN